MKLKIFIFSVSLFAALLLGEMIMRIIDGFVPIYDIEMAKYATFLKIPNSNPDRGHSHKKNSKVRLMGVDVSTNSLGLRDREYSLNWPHKTYRIIVLGDSMTLGWGVEREDSYPKKLEEILNKNISCKTGITYEVINTGVGNYNTVQELAYLKDEGYRLAPDMIILGFFVNDAEPVPKKAESLFLNHSHLMVFFWSRMNSIMSGVFKKGNYSEYYNNLYRSYHPGWIRCKNALIELNQYCNNNKIKFLVVFIPELHDLSDAYPLREAYNKVESFVKTQAMDYCDLYSYFRGYDSKKLWVSHDDAHPNKIGHEMIARGIYEYTVKKELLQ